MPNKKNVKVNRSTKKFCVKQCSNHECNNCPSQNNCYKNCIGGNLPTYAKPGAIIPNCGQLCSNFECNGCPAQKTCLKNCNNAYYNSSSNSNFNLAPNKSVVSNNNVSNNKPFSYSN